MKRIIRGSVTSSKTVNDLNYDIQYFQVFSNHKKPTDKGKMIAQAGTFEEAHQKGKKLAGENNYFLKAVCNDGKVRYIDNNYSGDIHSSEAVDNSEREFQRIDRSGTDEEVQLAAVMYNLGATLEEAREILPSLSEDKIKDYVDYYNLRDLPRSERLKIWNKRKVTSATDSEYALFKKTYSHSREFKDADKQSGNIRDLIDELENKGISYEIYDNKTDNGCTVFYDDDGTVTAASYGGAFDIEDDQYFTKDDIVEFGDHVCDHLNETFNDTYDIADVYMETPKKLVLTVMQKSDGSEFTAEVDIDMRRIRKPSDLVKSYWGDVVYALRQDIEAYNNEINSCDTITAAQKTGAEWIKTKVWNAIVAKLEDDGWEADDINDYVFVDVKQTDENIKVEVRAELSYEGLEDLISAIDPIVQEWDPDAYFEPVEPGIAEAYIWNFDKVNSSSNTEDTSEWYVGDSESGHMYKGKKTAEAALARLEKSGVEDAVMMPAEDASVQSAIKAGIYDVPERPLDPPEDDSWEEIDSDDEIVEITLDAIIHIDEDGSWEYDDTNYPWAASPDNKRGDWYTDEYNVYIGDKTSIVEYVDELLESMMPVTPGEYHIKGDVELVFSVSGIEVKRDYFWDERHGADYYEEAYTDNAETEFLYDKSSIKNFEITER